MRGVSLPHTHSRGVTLPQESASFGVRDMLSAVMSNGDLIQQLMSSAMGGATHGNQVSTPQQRYAAVRSLLSAVLGVLIRIAFLFPFGQDYVQVRNIMIWYNMCSLFH